MVSPVPITRVALQFYIYSLSKAFYIQERIFSQTVSKVLHISGWFCLKDRATHIHLSSRMDLLILHNPAILNGIRITVLDHHSFEETSQRWRAVGDTGTDLSDLIRIESQTSPTESDVRNNGAYQLSIAFLSSAVKTDIVLLKILAILLN